MVNKLKNFFTGELKIILGVILIMSLIMSTAAQKMTPIFKYTFSYVIKNVWNNKAEFAMKIVGGCDEPLQLITISVWMALHSWLLMSVYVFAITFIVALISFKSTNRILASRTHRLKGDFSLINQMKLIATWIILYSAGNLLIQIFGFSDFIYQILATLCQAGVLYFLLR